MNGVFAASPCRLGGRSFGIDAPLTSTGIISIPGRFNPASTCIRTASFGLSICACPVSPPTADQSAPASHRPSQPRPSPARSARPCGRRCDPHHARRCCRQRLPPVSREPSGDLAAVFAAVGNENARVRSRARRTAGMLVEDGAGGGVWVR